MKNRILQHFFAFGLTSIVAVALVRAQTPERAALIQRGRYLVENVGMCADCHSPRNEHGEFLKNRGLTGAPIAFAPSTSMPWAPVAPSIAGLPSLSESQSIEFLMKGRRPDGSPARPPMPEFRFNQDDATAVAAYLKSLAK